MSQTFYERKIYPQLKAHLNAKQVTVLTGMRRTGKTTLIKHLLSQIDSSNKIFIDLQTISNRELFSEKNYDNIIIQLRERGLSVDEKIYLAIDEIQLLPEITSVIKYLYDHYNIKFLVTGSSSYYLKNLFSESLAGRKQIFELYPLDFGEFLTFKQVPYKSADFIESKFNPHEYERLHEYYEEFIEYGGFPEVVLLNSIEQKTAMLSDIISSYIDIDIKTLSDFRRVSNIYKLIKMLAGRVGAKLDYMKLSRLTGISRTTVINYVELFEKTYLLARLPVHTKNPDREIVKASKLYFSDSGLVGVLADVNSGAKFENAIFSQLRHFGSLRYFSLKTGREIDYILDKKFALETKETPTETDMTELKHLSNTAGIPNFHIIGRHPSPKFHNYIWGGDIK